MQLISRQMTIDGRRDVYSIPGTTNTLIYEQYKYFVADEKGKPISERYDKLSAFENGLAIFNRGEKKGVVNFKGKEVLGKLYDKIGIDGDIIRICDGESWGFANSKGEIVCKPTYFFIESFAGNYARFRDKRNMWGIISKTGEILIRSKYDFISSLDQEAIIVKTICGYGVIDINDKVIVPLRYKYMKEKGEKTVLYNSVEDAVVV